MKHIRIPTIHTKSHIFNSIIENTVLRPVVAPFEVIGAIGDLASGGKKDNSPLGVVNNAINTVGDVSNNIVDKGTGSVDNVVNTVGDVSNNTVNTVGNLGGKVIDDGKKLLDKGLDSLQMPLIIFAIIAGVVLISK